MRRFYTWFAGWAVVLAMGSGLGAAASAAQPPLPPPVSVGPVEVKAVRWLAEGYNPVWGPDESFFLLSHAGKGFSRYRADGTGEKRLGKETDRYGGLSPDGKSVLFHQTRQGKSKHMRVPAGIGLMKSDGTGRRVISATAAYAAWSPDGRYFLCKNELSGPVAIYDRSGKVVRRLDYANGIPAWSGDGKYLAYVGKAGKIYLARGDGTAPKLADEPSGGETWAELWWSPKGHNLLYAWGGAYVKRPLCHVTPGGTPIELCDSVQRVEWSPTGDRAAAAFDGPICLFSFTTPQEPEMIAQLAAPRGYKRCCWSGDGSHFVYSTEEGLWAVDKEGGEPEPVGRPEILRPRVAVPKTAGVLCYKLTSKGSSELWLADVARNEAASVAPEGSLTCPSVTVAPSGRSMIGLFLGTDRARLLLLKITRRT